jgi:hypothetical protein
MNPGVPVASYNTVDISLILLLIFPAIVAALSISERMSEEHTCHYFQP